jgi:ribosome-associated toxin RatA of RatAB toxin-antitoxin module
VANPVYGDAEGPRGLSLGLEGRFFGASLTPRLPPRHAAIHQNLYLEFTENPASLLNFAAILGTDMVSWPVRTIKGSFLTMTAPTPDIRTATGAAPAPASPAMLAAEHADCPDLELGSAADSGVVIQTEKLEGQQRRILAFIDIPHTVEQVWQVLTDYDNLASFIPNLACSQRLSHPEGGIRLEQVGSQCFLNIKFCARVVLDMVETFPRELRFSMVEGDFRQFEGRWTLEPLTMGSQQRVRLGYILVIRPPRAMPVALIERHIRHDLTHNLTAIGDRTAALFAP